MLDIEYKGGNTVVISTKGTTVIADPNQTAIGQAARSTKDMIEVATEARFAVANGSLAIEGPGEYEIGNVAIKGVAAQRHIDQESTNDSTIYRIEAAGVRVALLGNIAPTLSDEQQEALGVVDIMIVPVGGGGYTLDATSAAGLVRQLDPKVVIPVHYADPTITYEVPQDEVAVFTKELAAPVEEVTRYRLKTAAGLPEVLTTVVVKKTS